MAISTPFALLQASADGSSLAVAADVASIVVAIAVIVMTVLASIVFFRFNRLLSRLGGAARSSFGPVSDRAKLISDNVEFITRALRTDVDRLNGSVRALTDRLHLASERMEERIEEFNALMEVVQGEAEEIFLDTASTVRGVREGARAIATPGRRRGETDPAPYENDVEGGDDAPDDDDLVQQAASIDADDEDADADIVGAGED